MQKEVGNIGRRDKFWLLSQLCHLSNMGYWAIYLSVWVNCHICYPGVIYFYLPGTAREWIKQGENQIVVEVIAYNGVK